MQSQLKNVNRLATRISSVSKKNAFFQDCEDMVRYFNDRLRSMQFIERIQQKYIYSYTCTKTTKLQTAIFYKIESWYLTCFSSTPWTSPKELFTDASVHCEAFGTISGAHLVSCSGDMALCKSYAQDFPESGTWHRTKKSYLPPALSRTWKRPAWQNITAKWVINHQT